VVERGSIERVKKKENKRMTRVGGPGKKTDNWRPKNRAQQQDYKRLRQEKKKRGGCNAKNRQGIGGKGGDGQVR